MNNINKLKQQFIGITMLGTVNGTSVEDVIRIRLLNFLYFTSSFFLVPLIIISVFFQDLENTIIVTFALLVETFVFKLNISGKQLLARYIHVLVLSGLLFLTVSFFENGLQPELFFLSIIFLTMIFFSGNAQKVLVIYQASLYFITEFVIPQLPNFHKYQIPTILYINEQSFIFYVLLSGVMLVFYQSEIKKHQMQQAQIIENLQFNNRQIETIKKEIEQYVFIITNRLKIQLESVNQTFIAINEHTKSKDYTALEQRLNVGISNSKQMYFWVNKVLEKTRFIETITAQYQEVNLNEVLENVKHSLVQTHLGINRIHSTDLPNVFVNESDIFIVMYSLCDVFLLDSSNSTIEITSISNDEYVEIIFQNESSNLIMNEYANSGLSLCQILVNNWHGWMSMDVMREKGNKISILIPANSHFTEIQNRNKKNEDLK